jgi:hypothetical protein
MFSKLLSRDSCLSGETMKMRLGFAETLEFVMLQHLLCPVCIPGAHVSEVPPKLCNFSVTSALFKSARLPFPPTNTPDGCGRECEGIFDLNVPTI